MVTYSSKSQTIMALVRKLHFIAASNNFNIHPITDALSHNLMSTFHRLVPHADPIMTPIPSLNSIL